MGLHQHLYEAVKEWGLKTEKENEQLRQVVASLKAENRQLQLKLQAAHDCTSPGTEVKKHRLPDGDGMVVESIDRAEKVEVGPPGTH